LEPPSQNSTAATPRVARLPLILLAVILAVAAFLRLAGLGAESFWWDEVLTTYSAREPVTHIIESVRGHENAPPLYFIVMNLWAKCFGMSDVSLRLPSALMGIATVAPLWRVGKELFDDTVALTAAALLAVSPIHIAYSQEARMYALLVLLLTLNLWAVARTMRTGSAAAQIAYVLTAALALYTHTFAAFSLVAVNLFWLARFVRRRKPGQTGVTWRRWLTLNGAVVVLFGPWAPATIEVARIGLPWLVKSTTVCDAMVGYAGSVVPAIAMAALSAAAVVRAWRRQDDRIGLLVLLGVVPVIGPIAYGAFTTRYGIAALIGLTMLVACGAAGIGRWACIAVVVLAAVTWGMTSTPGHARYRNYTPKVDVRGAMVLVRGWASDADVVVAGTRGIWHVMERYQPGTGLRIFMDVDAVAKERAERVWMIAPSGPSGADLAVTGYEGSRKSSLDGVDVWELRRVREPATTRSVPSTYPQN
jgi:mannosyltransferase